MYLIRNGRIITEDSILDGREVVIEDGRIAEVRAASTDGSRGPRIIDARGGYVAPGIIDIHADYIEHMAAPRPTALMDFGLALREAERELLTHGITTMFHSLSIYKYTEFLPNPVRNPENTKRFIELIHATHHAKHLIRHRMHARFEIDNLDRVEELLDYIRDNKVHLVSFMDHTPGQGQYRNLEIYRKTLKSYRDITDEEIDRVIVKSRAREKLTIDGIAEISRLAREMGIAVASHDDDTADKVALVKGFGATISEFPITMEVAREARRLGMHTVAGAPNVLLGGSHSGNLGAEEAIAEGAVDVLCSDYYPAAMLHAVFALAARGRGRLPELFRLISLNPARAVMMDGELGSIAAGKKADLLVVETIGGYPVVTRAFVDGNLSLSVDYRE